MPGRWGINREWTAEIAAQAVAFLDGVDAGVISTRDLAQGFTALYDMTLPVNPLLFVQPGELFIKLPLSINRYQQIVGSVGVGGPAIESGVQCIEFIHAQTGQFGGQGQIQLSAHVHPGEVGRGWA